MTRSKTRLEYIANDADRKASFKKRKMGLLKKAQELSTLCGVEGCAIIYSPYESEPAVWPSQLDAQRVISRYQQLPEMEHTRRVFNQESYTEQRIRKSQEQIEKLQRENRRKDVEIIMHQCMAGLVSPYNVPVSYVGEIKRLAEQNMHEIAFRMDEMQKNGAVTSQTGGNLVQNFPLMNPSLHAGFGWGNLPHGFQNPGPAGPSFSTQPQSTDAPGPSHI